MSRHNRRRTRGGHKGKASSTSGSNSGSGSSSSGSPNMSMSMSPLYPDFDHPLSPPDQPPLLQVLAPSYSMSIYGRGGMYRGSGSGGSSTSPTSARAWHNRYMAWQARERRQRDESAALKADMSRIFGEADGSGEDEGLCVKMLEYFGGLDFIDP